MAGNGEERPGQTQAWVAGVLGSPQESGVLREGRRLRPQKRAPTALHPHLCPQVLLRESGWRQLEQHRARRRSQALLTLHRSLRACISRQRLGLLLLPRMQARVRGLQARSAGVG